MKTDRNDILEVLAINCPVELKRILAEVEALLKVPAIALIVSEPQISPDKHRSEKRRSWELGSSANELKPGCQLGVEKF